MTTRPAPSPPADGTERGPTTALPAELFDCVQVNLALLADGWHGAGTHRRLGAVLRFRPAPGPAGLPTVEVPAARQLADAAGPLGIAVRALRPAGGPADVLPGAGCLVVADAYHLPWVPYFRQRHIGHGFLVRPGGAPDAVTVVDAYHNDTPWGRARPGSWQLSGAELAAALPGPAVVADLAPEPAGPPPAVPGADLADPAAVDGYAAAYASHPDRVAALRRLTLETWLLARARALHAAFLAAVPAAGPGAAALRERTAAWAALTEQTYLACRRAERGRPAPADLFGRLAALLHADRELLGGPGASGPQGQADDRPPEALRRAVAAVAAEVLGTDAGQLLAGRPLNEVPAYSSFRVVEIVERLEQQLDFEFAADDLVPENLRRLDALCRAVHRCGGSVAAFGEAR